MSQLQINQDFQDKVKERIGNMVADMLTDEQLDTMIKTSYEDQIQKFIDEETKKIISDEIKKNISQYLVDEYNANAWNVKINEKLKEMIIENSGAIFATLMSDSVQLLSITLVRLVIIFTPT